MEEARRVLERLRRIEVLRERTAETGRLLEELRALLAEGEAWLAAERRGTPPASLEAGALGAAQAFAAFGKALERGPLPATDRDAGGEGGRRPQANREEVVTGTHPVEPWREGPDRRR